MRVFLSICIAAGIGICVYYREWGGAVAGVVMLIICQWVCTWVRNHPVKRVHRQRKKAKRYFEVTQPWEARFFK